MEEEQALLALGALSQATRLHLFRLLLSRGAGGVSAGVIAEHLGIAPSSLSFHLTQLVQAGLIAQRREGRQLIYSAESGPIDDLRRYLGTMRG
jgi:ArsR family transcriptional regulator